VKRIHYQKGQEIPMILITGIPKTGSTALFYSIRSALPDNSNCVFEPSGSSALIPAKSSAPVLVKCFMKVASDFDHFNKKILIIRDPRDQIISQMLYRPFNLVVKKMITPENKLKSVIDHLLFLLHEKEKNPHKIPVREIHELIIPKAIGIPQERLMKYYLKHRNVFVFKYEDFIDKKFDGLNRYLGLNVSLEDNIPIKRVIRTKSYGNWKDWFTPSDIEYYQVLFEPYMKLFGYNNNWSLNPNPIIDPAMSSLYVEQLLTEAGYFRKTQS